MSEIPHSLRYQFVEHTADIAIRAYGKTLEEVFANSALGMMDFLFGKEVVSQQPEKMETETETETIVIEAIDKESLLVDFLSELLTRSLTTYRAFVNIHILQLSETRLTAEIGSVPAQARDDIKAVTYYDLRIEQKDGIWQALVTYDI